mmetsp:Transcript_58912/g.93721  ORF Transcript_58912/g.93721 Transcript_58912/m.93721 type:complete len:107 (+) Transcript_58912:1-321(+)
MPLIIGDANGESWKLKEQDLNAMMSECHAEYAKYLIGAANRVGEKLDTKDMNKMRMVDVNQKLLNMVYSNLEKARVYADKYDVLTDEIVNELQGVWQQKQEQYPVS